MHASSASDEITVAHPMHSWPLLFLEVLADTIACTLHLLVLTKTPGCGGGRAQDFWTDLHHARCHGWLHWLQ